MHADVFADDQLARLMTLIDSDGSGTIDYRELVEFVDDRNIQRDRTQKAVLDTKMNPNAFGRKHQEKPGKKRETGRLRLNYDQDDDRPTWQLVLYGIIL